uniref:Sodefrin-like factor n=1 Tax=Panagrolaimus sp. JU765 TaxID=591449 RepID=A0AC34PXK6_9BILA
MVYFLNCGKYFLLIICWNFWISTIKASNCFSCAGTCHSEPCNCQMGSCKADYCFTERKPTEIPGIFKIVKGCLKRPSRTHHGCDYDHFPDHIQCRDPDCSETCQGQWCHEDTATGSTGCGYGPPSLPFFYKGPELLFHRSKICITMSRGNNAKPRRHCICNTHMCNDFRKQPFIFDGNHGAVKYSEESGGTNGQPRSRSLVTYNYATHKLPLYSCVSCDTTAQDNAMTSS